MDNLRIASEFNFRYMTMDEFFQRVASPKFPNPTGGGAAAVTALAGLHLLILTLNVNLAKVNDTEVIHALTNNSRLLEVIKDSIWELMTKDIVVVDKLIKVTKQQEYPQRDEVKNQSMLSACSTLVAMLDRIMDALHYVDEIREVNRVKTVTSDLESGYWLLLGAAKAVIVLIKSNLQRLSEGADKQNIQAKLRIASQKLLQFYEQKQ